MATADRRFAESLLPLFLSLPPGTIAGVPGGPPLDTPRLESDFARFGPRLRSEVDLRHAARRPPPRAVVEFQSGAAAVSEAALSALALAGAAVLLHSADVGQLVRLCHRLVAPGASGPAWVSAGELRASRSLLLRVEPPVAERWLRFPLGEAGAEGVLATCRTLGIEVRESRVVYHRRSLR
jgi:hypothetical protein